MANPQQYLVSTSGQMSLPAAARKRWGLEHGGPVEVLDLGYTVIVRPVKHPGQALKEWHSEDDHHWFVTTDDDPDLRTT